MFKFEQLGEQMQHRAASTNKLLYHSSCKPKWAICFSSFKTTNKLYLVQGEGEGLIIEAYFS